jgi:predicted  nucleic acid-binding Zn-ribbon protein
MKNLNNTKTGTIEGLQAEIAILQVAICQAEELLSDIQNSIDNFADENDLMLHQIYDDMLDECYSDQLENVTFISLSSPSNLLAEYDPTAYHCGFNDWLDGYDLDDLSEYSDLVCEIEEQDEIIETSEEGIADLQDEIEDLEEGDL